MTRLNPGDQAPDFTLNDAAGASVRLSHEVSEAKNGVVVYFYPRAMTPGCTTQACDFRDSLDALSAAGYRVLGVSGDEEASLAKFSEKEGLTFPLLSDPGHGVSTQWGAFGEKKLYGKTVTGPIRSTVVVSPDGTVRLAQYAVKATGHVARLRRELGID